MRQQLKVSIIIANYNGEKFLAKCLQSIFIEPRQAFEVIVVDDASEDGSVALLNNKFRKEKRLKLIALSKNVGAAAARNIGAERSCGKYLFFLDNDTKVKPGWLDEISRFFDKYSQTGLAQAKLLTMGTNKFDYAGDLLSPFGFLIERARGATDKGQFDNADQIFSGKSAAMLVRRDVFEQVKGFDEDYKIFWEDTDLAWRVWLAGHMVSFCPNVIVWHAFWTKEKDLAVYVKNKIVYRGCRNMLTTLIKNLEVANMLRVVPINAACWFILALLFLLRTDARKSKAILGGVAWNILNFHQAMHKRADVQASRKITDRQLFALVGTQRGISYYLGKARAYITGQSF